VTEESTPPDIATTTRVSLGCLAIPSEFMGRNIDFAARRSTPALQVLGEAQQRRIVRN
jgi:hypothetical protein